MVVADIDSKLPKKILNEKVDNVVVRLSEVKPGEVFIILKNENGKDLALGALEKGAKFVLAPKNYKVKNCYKVTDPRRIWTLFEKKLHNDAVKKLKVIGITGTNGKTTTSFIIYNILKEAKKRVAVIGTLGCFFDDKKIETGFTTPDPDILHSLFETLLVHNIEYVVMEVSAHALALSKVAGIEFETAVLTNITQDHLDFFKNMKIYAKTKLNIFKQSKKAVIFDGLKNLKFLKKINIPTKYYGFDESCDVYGYIKKMTLYQSVFDCFFENNNFQCNSTLVGEYNILNCLAGISVALNENISIFKIKKALQNMEAVEGRCNLKFSANKQIIVDFAHTPDGMEKLLEAVRPLISGKIITVFGCGGNRDRKKRAIMGNIASKLSDRLVLTSDNPRFEEPMSIILDIVEGVDKNIPFCIEPNREKAINLAIMQAQANDVVVIAGKGGETYQDIAGVKVPYNDFEVVDKILNKIT